jgi:hypothetical protein
VRISTNSEPLVQEDRDAIRDAWNVPIYNLWGSTEIGVQAVGCGFSEGLHICEDEVVLERVDDFVVRNDKREGPVTPGATLGNQAIGAAGELFIQYQLIKRGIDSARLTTESGIDLVMYVPGTLAAHTVQVKATQHPLPLWTWHRTPALVAVPSDVTCKAQWLAVVDLPRDRAWLFRSGSGEPRELRPTRQRDADVVPTGQPSAQKDRLRARVRQVPPTDRY